MSLPRVDPDLLSLLTSEDFESFTSQQLLEAFMLTSSPKARSRKNARQFIVRNIERLKSKGFLETVRSDTESKTIYRSTSLLHSCMATNKREHVLKNVDVAPASEYIESLQRKLNGHKNEMLLILGETEEYEDLCIELPQIKGEIQEHYNQARERCTKILGRIRALESIITNHNKN